MGPGAKTNTLYRSLSLTCQKKIARHIQLCCAISPCKARLMKLIMFISCIKNPLKKGKKNKVSQCYRRSSIAATQRHRVCPRVPPSRGDVPQGAKAAGIRRRTPTRLPPWGSFFYFPRPAGAFRQPHEWGVRRKGKTTRPLGGGSPVQRAGQS
jgi:hypothetical protein